MCEEESRKLPLLSPKTNGQRQSKKWCNIPWNIIKRMERFLISRSSDNLHSNISQNCMFSSTYASVAQILSRNTF